MNQLMNLERVRKVEPVRRIVKLKRNEKTIADNPDVAIAISATHRFRSGKNLELTRILCEVRTGILTIRGQVSSYYLKQVAQEMVRSLAGVNRIVNHLKVVHVHNKSGKPETP